MDRKRTAGKIEEPKMPKNNEDIQSAKIAKISDAEKLPYGNSNSENTHEDEVEKKKKEENFMEERVRQNFTHCSILLNNFQENIKGIENNSDPIKVTR